MLVARAGFEPAISALRGQRPWPLDERAVWLAIQDSNLGTQIQSLVSYRWTNRQRSSLCGEGVSPHVSRARARASMTVGVQ